MQPNGKAVKLDFVRVCWNIVSEVLLSYFVIKKDKCERRFDGVSVRRPLS